MTTFTRKIVAVDWDTVNGMANTLTVLHYNVQGEDENGTTGRNYGTVSLEAPDPANFTPKESLTEADVMAWIPEEDWAEWEANVQAQIDQKNDTSKGSGLPWAS